MGERYKGNTGVAVYIGREQQKRNKTMAKYRNVQFAFWTDGKIIDNFTPEDKYFYLYLMTNPHTSLCGCYEISTNQMALETGYQKDVIDKLIVRFTEEHDVIRYDCNTKEMLILHWYKYNWAESGKTMIGVEKGINAVKNDVFREYLINLFNGNTDVSIEYVRGMYAPSMGYVYPLYVTFTFISNSKSLNTFSVSDTDKDKYSEDIKNIINYFNNTTGKKYKTSSKTTCSHIRARLSEGFSVDDFKRVIDVKYAQWKDDPKMCEYIRPETLFGTKFETYLNQSPVIKPKDKFEKQKDILEGYKKKLKGE